MWTTDRTGSGSDRAAREELRHVARPLENARDLDPLLELIGDSRFVLLGEASHGTHEYYTWRTEITKRLIAEKGFSFIGVEGDWPDCYRVNCYVKGAPDSGESAFEVLHAFDRWPTWMWANREIVELAEWLKEWNSGQPDDRKVGFYGLDVYSLWDSMDSVLKYLERNDPSALPVARSAYRCFEPYGEDAQQYAWATRIVPTTCEREVVEVLAELRRKQYNLLSLDGKIARERFFNAEQNALVARNAERYYRAMVRGGASSWNIRDEHMTETLDRLWRHYGTQSKAIVWEHNTHIGDARATDMARDGMVNIGQLARERFAGEGVVLVGFGSHRGSVIAGEEWGAPMKRMPVPEARPGSWEALMHEELGGDRLLITALERNAPGLREVRGHRAIGVVYHPDREMWGNYVPTVLAYRYDAFLYLDRTHALRPLHMHPREEHEFPETYPSGL